MASSDDELAPVAPNDSQDDDLLRRARSNDQRALTELYNKHRTIALHVAQSVSQRVVPEDVFQQAFTNVIAALTNGRGPTEGFRPYLLAAVRREAAQQARKSGREIPHYEVSDGRAVEPLDTAAADRDLVRRLTRRLGPEPTRSLWLTAVEERRPAELASETTTANTAAAAASRAREGARRSLLLEQVSPAERDDYTDLLPTLVRGKMSNRARATLDRHLGACAKCSRVLDQLTAFDRNRFGDPGFQNQ